MIRAVVTAIDARGVYIRTSEFGEVGPLSGVGGSVSVGQRVLAANAGDDVTPDLAVVGSATFDIRDFGARQGVNAQPAIAAAITAAESVGGGEVTIPAGVWLLDEPVAGGNKVWIQAVAGRYACTLRATGDFPVMSGLWTYCIINGVTLDAANHGGAGISAHLDQTRLERVTVQRWTGYAMKLNDGSYADALGLLNAIDGCFIDAFPGEGVGVGIHTGYRFADSWIVNTNIGSTLENINLEGGPVRVLGCHLDGAPERNIFLRGNRRILIANNILEGSSKEAIKYAQPPFEMADADQQIQIVGNTISNGGKGSPGDYPAIGLVGKGGGVHGVGFQVVGNTIACDDAGADFSYALDGDHVKQVVANGNTWYSGYTESTPVRLTNSSDYEVTGNVQNGVTTT